MKVEITNCVKEPATVADIKTPENYGKIFGSKYNENYYYIPMSFGVLAIDKENKRIVLTDENKYYGMYQATNVSIHLIFGE